MSLRVVEPGLFTLVVDMGRPGHRSLGVPADGAADKSALALANALVGNAPAAAALEVTLAGPTLQADVPLACVLYGAPFSLRTIRAVDSENPFVQELASGKTFSLNAGDQVHIAGPLAGGARAYFCVQGGLQTSEVFGSRSAFEPLRAGAVLACQPGKIRTRFLPEFIWPTDAPPAALNDSRRRGSEFLALRRVKNDEPRVLRVVRGLQASWFDERQFSAQDFVVTPASNRMGLRLQGQPLDLPRRELVSEAVCPGAVQVTSDGQCIILGVDGQTIGGYPKIAQVIAADLDRVGQLRPGDRLHFRPVSLEEARRLHKGRQKELAAWVLRLQTTLGII